MNKVSKFAVNPGGCLQGSISVPGDKSMSHRALILASIAEGVSHIKGFLQGEDSLNTLQAFREMGISISDPKNSELIIEGKGLYGLRAANKPLYLGNSGTSMRLLSGLLAAQSFDSVLEGDESLSKRPMKRVIQPLTLMGADIRAGADDFPPLQIHRVEKLTGIHYVMPIASAQVKSCLLLAGLYAHGKTSITEPAPTRDHTERMLESFSCSVQRIANTVSVEGGARLRATTLSIPGDISSAAFFIVGASLAKDSNILLLNIGINPTRTGILDILSLMGANITLENQRFAGAEPVADIRVRSAKLNGIAIPKNLVPLAIDEFPVILIAAACASGKTVLTDAQELRVKETDRIRAMAEGLTLLGSQVVPTNDGMIIEGNPADRVFSSAQVDSYGDHRIAMAFAIAALRAKGRIMITNCENVATSFPNFHGLAAAAGLSIEVIQ